MPLPRVHLPFAPYRLSGVVLGCLMNHRPALEALGTAVDAPPYKAAPKAPVLYIKPATTRVDASVIVSPGGNDGRHADGLKVSLGGTARGVA